MYPSRRGDKPARGKAGLGGIPRETLNLVVLEGLRQLGLDDVEVLTDDRTG